MPASLKITRLAETGAHLRHHKFAVSGFVGFGLMLLAGSAVLAPAGLQTFSTSPAKDHGKDHSDVNRTSSAANWAGSFWAGGLELPRPEGQSTNFAQKEAPLSSAAYTSGFDKQAAGLGPLPPAQRPLKFAQPRDPRACPDNLNCSFRPAKAAAVRAAAPACCRGEYRSCKGIAAAHRPRLADG